MVHPTMVNWRKVSFISEQVKIRRLVSNWVTSVSINKSLSLVSFPSSNFDFVILDYRIIMTST
jgi:hypothetical protein